MIQTRDNPKSELNQHLFNNKFPNLPTIILTILTLPLGPWLYLILKPKIENALFVQSGTSRLDLVLSNNEYVSLISVSLVYYILVYVTYYILSLGTSKYISLILTLMFVNSGPVLIVFLSSPFYNVLSRLYVLLSILVITFLLRPLDIWIKTSYLLYMLYSYFFLISFIYFYFIIDSIFRAVFDYSSLITFIIYFLMWISFLVLRFKLKLKSLTREEILYLLCISTLILMLLLDYLTGQSRIFNIFFFIPLFFLSFFTSLKVRIFLKLTVSFILFFTLIYIWIVKSGLTIGLSFYPLTSFQNSSILLDGGPSNPIQLGINFSDTSFAVFSERLQQEKGGLGSLLSLVQIFLPNVLSNLSTNLHIIFQGGFLYFDPVIPFLTISHSYWTYISTILSFISLVACFVVPALLSKINMRLFFLNFILLLVLIFLPLVSRLSYHQYWFFPIYGLWAVGFLINFLINKKLNYHHISMNNSLTKFSRNFRIEIFMLILFLLYVIFQFGLLDNWAKNVQTNQVSALIKSYNNLPNFNLYEQNTSVLSNSSALNRRIFTVPLKTKMINVKSQGSICSINGLKVLVKESSSDVPIRFQITSDVANSLYIPLVSNTSSSQFSLEILQFNECYLDVLGVDTTSLENPLFALVETSNNAAVEGGPLRPKTHVNRIKQSIELDQVRGKSKSRKVIVGLDYPLFFEGRIESFGYKSMSSTHDFHRRPESDLSSQVLGLTDQGRFASDIWRSRPTISKFSGSISIKGYVTRGASIIGVTYGENQKYSEFVPFSNHKIIGSSYDTKRKPYEICFPIFEGEIFRVFAGAVVDLYSISWVNQTIESVIQSDESCPEVGNLVEPLSKTL